MWEIFIDKLPLIIIVAVIVLVLFNLFPIVFFFCFVVPFLALKTVYHAIVKYVHEHSLWWDIPLLLAAILFIILIVSYLYGYRW